MKRQFQKLSYKKQTKTTQKREQIFPNYLSNVQVFNSREVNASNSGNFNNTVVVSIKDTSPNRIKERNQKSTQNKTDGANQQIKQGRIVKVSIKNKNQTSSLREGADQFNPAMAINDNHVFISTSSNDANAVVGISNQIPQQNFESVKLSPQEPEITEVYRSSEALAEDLNNERLEQQIEKGPEAQDESSPSNEKEIEVQNYEKNLQMENKEIEIPKKEKEPLKMVKTTKMTMIQEKQPLEMVNTDIEYNRINTYENMVITNNDLFFPSLGGNSGKQSLKMENTIDSIIQKGKTLNFVIQKKAFKIDRTPVNWNKKNVPTKTTKIKIQSVEKPTWNDLTSVETLPETMIPSLEKPLNIQQEEVLFIPKLVKPIILNKVGNIAIIAPKKPGKEVRTTTAFTLINKVYRKGVENQVDKFVIPGIKPPSWNMLNQGRNENVFNIYSKPRPELEVSKEFFFKIGPAYVRDWNLMNNVQLSSPLGFAPTKKELKMVKIANLNIKRSHKLNDWNKIITINKNDKKNTVNINATKKKWTLSEDKTEGVFIGRTEETYAQNEDQYEMGHNVTVRPVKAIIQKIMNDENEEDNKDIDPLENIGKNSNQIYHYETNINVNNN